MRIFSSSFLETFRQSSNNWCPLVFNCTVCMYIVAVVVIIIHSCILHLVLIRHFQHLCIVLVDNFCLMELLLEMCQSLIWDGFSSFCCLIVSWTHSLGSTHSVFWFNRRHSKINSGTEVLFWHNFQFLGSFASLSNTFNVHMHINDSLQQSNHGVFLP